MTSNKQISTLVLETEMKMRTRTNRMLTKRFALVVFIGGITTLLALGGSTARAQSQLPSISMQRKFSETLKRGTQLSAAEANALELGLTADPNNSETRLKLLAFYSSQPRSAAEYALRYRHLFWAIEHLAREPLCRSEFACRPTVEAEQCEHGATLWASNVAKFPDDAEALRNAAYFTGSFDRTRSLEYYHKGRTLQPMDGYWPLRIALLYESDVVDERGAIDAEIGRECLIAYEEASQLIGEAVPQYDLKGRLARAAYYAGEDSKARKYADEVIGVFSALLGNDAYPRNDRSEMVLAIHRVKLVLGLVALREGDVGKACEYLSAAGDFMNAPELASFGPNMLLALELIKEDQRDAVVQYIQKCGNVWHNRSVGVWIEDVRAGRVPKFGANLRY